MIKLIVFDLDGVLVDTKALHYESLNNALRNIDVKYLISEDEHIKKYDGLTTKTKLIELTKDKGLPEIYYKQIWCDKQKETLELIKNTLTEDLRLKTILKQLKDAGYMIYVASNSIRETVKLMLYKTGLIEFVDYYLSNDDINNPKPNPEIYLRCMVHAGVKPSETLIIEDSLHGIESAIASGAVICPVTNPSNITIDYLQQFLLMGDVETKWVSNDINVLIPMAGIGSRFQNAGFLLPKPLININGKPMIEIVINNLNIRAKFIYIVQKEHYIKYNLGYLLNLITPNCEIVQVDGITEGAACTTLLAKDYINNDKNLIIANSDQFIEWDSNMFYYSILNNKADGTVLTFNSTHPKWSFVKLDDNGFINEIAEKKPISDIATVGIYHWSKGSDYVKYAESMISKNIRVNNEFYVAPVYNEAISNGLKIKSHKINKMWGLGTPEDLEHFIKNYGDE